MSATLQPAVCDQPLALPAVSTERYPLERMDAALAASARVHLGRGDQVGPYRLLDRIGEGGMGTVFLAEQKMPLRRTVALKIVKLGMDTREVLARFAAERQAIALMNHPNVAAVLDAGATESGRPYFAMEYVAGVPITHYCDDHRLTVAQRLELFTQACQGIQHAHQKGIIHRDVKPGNVLVTEQDGRPLVKVIDFGIAKSTQHKLGPETIHTRLGAFIGTPDYTSPEQARPGAADVDTRTDVYALGVMLYELLVGEGPYDPRTFREKPLEEIQRIIHESEPPTPVAKFDSLRIGRQRVACRRATDCRQLRRQLRSDVAWIVLRAMEKDRSRRYPSAAALADDVGRFLAGEPVVARPPSRLYRLGKFARRHRLGLAIAAMALVGLVGTSVAMTGLYLEARAAKVLAQQEAQAAQQVSGFLVGLFEQADPERAGGATITARKLLDDGARRIRTELSGQPVIRARLLRTLAEIHEELGLLEAAETLAREALAVDRLLLGSHDPETAAALNALANVLESRGEAEPALTHYREALDINRRAHGANHPLVAAGLSDIGGMLEQAGQLDSALRHLERALAIDLAAFGPDHPRVASDLNDLGNIYAEMERYPQALDHYRQALDINRAALGPAHPELAGDLADIAAVHHELGEHDLARSHFERALAIAEPGYGVDHPEVAEILHGLAETRLELDDGAGARVALERALLIRRERLGEGHQETRETAELLAEL